MTQDITGYRGSALGFVSGGQESIIYSGQILDQWTDKAQKPDDATYWGLGSCTKSFTATVFAKLADQGVASPGVKLYDLIKDRVPSGAVPAPLKSITLEGLASMSAGLPDVPEFLPLTTVDSLFRALMDPHTYGAPNAFRYSDMSYALLSYATLIASGRAPAALSDWPQAVYGELKTRVLESLGLKSAAFYPPPKAPPYSFPYGYHNLKQVNGSKANWPAYDGAGALFMTAPDLMRWLKANMAGREGPLGSAAVFVQSDPAPTHGYSEGQQIARGWFNDTFTNPSPISRFTDPLMNPATISRVMVNKNGDVPGFSCGIAFQKPATPGGVSELGAFYVCNYYKQTMPYTRAALTYLMNP